jgi:nucleoside-diphosphate-sugar epimerase
MSTIILGGSGFLGPQILKKYPDIISVGRTKPVSAVHHVDCPSIEHLPKVLDKLDFDKVIMMIGSSNHTILNEQKPYHLEAIDKNLIPLTKILSYFQQRPIKKLISFSSILLYDRDQMILPVDESQPLRPYQNNYIFSKYLGEQVANFYSEIPNIIVRLTNIYGPTTALNRPDLVNQLVEGLVFNKKAKVLNLKPQRDFIYTEDASDAIVKLLYTDYTGPVNVASGQINSVADVVRILEDESKIKIELGDGPATGHMKFVADISLIKKLTGWEPKFDLDTGLRETYRKMCEMYHLN